MTIPDIPDASATAMREPAALTARVRAVPGVLDVYASHTIGGHLAAAAAAVVTRTPTPVNQVTVTAAGDGQVGLSVRIASSRRTPTPDTVDQVVATLREAVPEGAITVQVSRIA